MKPYKFFTVIFLLMTSLAMGKEIRWNIDTFFDGQIFPSYSWAASFLGEESVNTEGNFFGDQLGQVGVIIEGLKKGQKVKIEIADNEVMEKSTLEFEMAINHEEAFYAYPEILYKWSLLEKWNQPKPINLKLALYIDGKLIGTDTKRLIVRSINDCPFLVGTSKGIILDLNYVYLSYVNENHPLITDVILPEILEEGIIKSITGYQGVYDGNYDSVYKQVYAVWNYFNKNNFYYSSLTSNFKNSGLPFVSAQFVRTFTDIYKTKQANCVEGTVLMASILSRMGISSYLVTTPNHCYLGFDLDPAGNNIAFLETTLLGTNIEDINPEDRTFVENFNLTNSDAFYRLQLNGKSTYDMFIYALLMGNMNYNEDADKFRGDTAEPYLIVNENMDVNQASNILNYRIVSVNYYRKLGLLPINL